MVIKEETDFSYENSQDILTSHEGYDAAGPTVNEALLEETNITYEDSENTQTFSHVCEVDVSSFRTLKKERDAYYKKLQDIRYLCQYDYMKPTLPSVKRILNRVREVLCAPYVVEDENSIVESPAKAHLIANESNYVQENVHEAYIQIKIEPDHKSETAVLAHSELSPNVVSESRPINKRKKKDEDDEEERIWQAKIERLQEKIDWLERENKESESRPINKRKKKDEDDEEERIWQAKIERLQEKIDWLERENKELIEKESSRQKLDTKAGSGAIKNWNIFEEQLTDESLRRLFPLVGLSKTWYSFLKNGLDFPVPSLNVLQKWVSQQCTLEFVGDVINLMENQAEQNISSENMCIVTIESSTQTKEPEISLKSLIGEWEQLAVTPSGQEFSQELLLNTITEAENCGYSVLAVESSDVMKKSFWRTLIEDSSKPGFPNPVDENRTVWVVPSGEIDRLRELLSDDAVRMFKEYNCEPS